MSSIKESENNVDKSHEGSETQHVALDSLVYLHHYAA
jgi:hypothetical protein